MHIVHAGASATPNQVNGLNQMVWTVARHQARMGHRVDLILTEPPSPDGMAAARDWGITLIQAPPLLKGGLSWWPPASADVLHAHSVFIPMQAFLCAAARRHGVPYVITPNGGVNPNILRRGALKKGVYSRLVEQPRFLAAAAITAVTPMEEEEIRAFVPGFRGAVPCIHNPVDMTALTAADADGDRMARGSAKPRLVYMGRFDIAHKGLDLLLDTARRLPECELVLYGNDAAALGGLSLPDNARLHSPVYGADKITALRGADLYIQTSRWEAFGVSVAEAMALGVPCAITETMSLAPIFTSADLGLVLPFDAAGAAERLRHALGDPGTLESWSARARHYAIRRFSPDAIAHDYLATYEAMLVGRNERQLGWSRAGSGTPLP
jgi:glycosyltransferase involved in cell wall biosynthesis